MSATFYPFLVIVAKKRYNMRKRTNVMNQSRKISFMIITAIYIAALATGTGVFVLLPGADVLWRLAAADGAATVFVWLASLITRNASVYDPYWSVAPPVLLAGLILYEKTLDTAALLIWLLLILWGIRLTANWAVGFKGLHAQDWRYTDFERAHPRLWPLINLFGIQLMPTAVVFTAMLPAFYAVLRPAGFGFFTVPAALFTLAAVWLEGAADAQLQRFRGGPQNVGKVNDRGLWKYSRHPNYLGEILFWWGIFLTSLSAAPLPWWTVSGPVVVTALFLFVSIPMMEKRQLGTKPGYRLYREKTGMLLPKIGEK